MNTQRTASLALGLLSAMVMASCAGPLYYARNPAFAGQPMAGVGQLQGSYSPTQASGMGAWGPQVRGGLAQANSGGAFGGTPASGPGAMDRSAQIVSPGSTGVGAPLTQPYRATTPLYGDNGVVQAEALGSRMMLDAPARDLEPGGTGRPLMLQQFQDVLEDRDALRIEVQALTGQLQLMQDRIVELQSALQGGDFARVELEQLQNSLNAVVEELDAENAELAARLVTAQIRRLEAEKDLIQVLIDNQRQAATDAVRECAQP